MLISEGRSNSRFVLSLFLLDICWFPIFLFICCGKEEQRGETLSDLLLEQPAIYSDLLLRTEIYLNS